jgi:hypothetical protein
VTFNPAGLAQISKKELALNHMSYIEDINAQFGAFTLPFNSVNGTLGFGFTYYNLGTIDRRDELGAAEDGSTSLSAYSPSVSWGQALGDNLALGGGLQFFNEDFAGETASSFFGNLGALWYAVPNRFSLGASILNLGPKVKLGTTEESLPLTYRVGGAFTAVPDALVLSVDAEKERDTDLVMHGGAEYTYRQFFVRGGYRDTLGLGGGWSFGGGFLWVPGQSFGRDFFSQKDKISNEGTTIRIDYGYVDYGDFDATHRIGILLSF